MLGLGPVPSWSLLKVPGLTPGPEDLKIYTIHIVPPYMKTTQSLASVTVQAAPVTSTESACIINSDPTNLRILIITVK
jgi:hypothetical protein